MPKDTGKKLADMMYGQNPEQAAFGVFPQMKPRRSRQDPEAAKNVPVDLARGFVAGTLGMPGDLESFARLPYELITGNESPTILPTSEQIEKRLPFGSDTPASRAAAGLGSLAGGFYIGPGSGARAMTAVPKAVVKASKDFAKAAGQPAVQVVKSKDGNWLGGSNTAGVVENQLGKLKMSDKMTPEWYADRERWLKEAESAGNERQARAIKQDIEVGKRNDAVNDWVDRNLTNYVKKQMATPEDPVRKLAEQGILHMEPYGTREAGSLVMRKRAGLGYPAQGLGQSEQAKFWERLSDSAIDSYPAGAYKYGALDNSLLEANPWLKNVPDETMIHSGKGLTRDLGFDHIIDVLRQDVREGRIRPEQLSKVSMEQAVRRTYEYDQEMAKKMREAQVKATEGMPVYKEYPEGFRWVELAGKKSKPEIVEMEGGGWTIKDNTGYLMSGGFKSKEGAEKALAQLSKTDKRYKEGISQESEKALEDALKYEGETMGHCVGGYCPDVLEGRSRIYSLRDAKGEPHVTIEVNPSSQRVAPRHEEILAEMKASGLDTSKLDESAYDAAYEQALQRVKQNRPPAIVQIKGKQNRAPKEEYLPFVQDFVRTGQWSGVGDFQNTGLVRKSDLIDKFTPEQLDSVGVGEYLTKGEYSDLLLQALQPTTGKARGGRVHISDNPDVMQLELAGGGAVAALKAMLNGGAARKAAGGEITADDLILEERKL